MSHDHIPKKVLLQVLCRSLVLQASWNFERLQNLGALFVLAPALRHLYRGEELEAAFARHLAYFNTHPFLAAPLLGAVVGLEESRSRGEEGYLAVTEFKQMVMAPYAAMGDALFWGGVRPLAAVVALFFAVKGSLWAPVVFMVLFNLPHFWFRAFEFYRGYRMNIRVVEAVQRLRLPDLALRFKEGTVVLLGGLCAHMVFLTLSGDGHNAGWGLVVLPAVGTLGMLARRGVSTLMLVLTTSALLLAISRLG